MKWRATADAECCRSGGHTFRINVPENPSSNPYAVLSLRVVDGRCELSKVYFTFDPQKPNFVQNVIARLKQYQAEYLTG